MKDKTMSAYDKILLRKRSVIETIDDELKNVAMLVHSRHRSFDNFLMNVISVIAAYCFFDKKPAINMDSEIVDPMLPINRQLTALLNFISQLRMIVFH